MPDPALAAIEQLSASVTELMTQIHRAFRANQAVLDKLTAAVKDNTRRLHTHDLEHRVLKDPKHEGPH